jgi:hemoglobin-like flavoprotein
MTPEQIALVQGTWAKVVPIKDTAAELFYARLFELDPSLRTLFKGDMKEQGRKLMAMINVAVAALDKLDTIVPAVKDLGRRHSGYGVRPQDYGTVATALLWTLEKGLGDAFTPAVKEAWTQTYMVLAQTMQAAGARAPEPAPVD